VGAVLSEVWVEDAAFSNWTVSKSAPPYHDVGGGAFDLIAQAVGIDDGATFEAGDDAIHRYVAGSGHRPGLRRRWLRSRVFQSRRPAEPIPADGFFLSFQANFSAGGYEKSAEDVSSLIFFRRNSSGHFDQRGELSMWTSARENDCGGGEAAVEALAQRRIIYGNELDALSWECRSELEIRGAGIVCENSRRWIFRSDLQHM